MSRFFSKRQKLYLRLYQEILAQFVRNILKHFHADHIKPYAKNGQTITNMVNLYVNNAI